MAQPTYISFLHHGEASVELPVSITNAMFYGFAVASDGAKVQKFLDSTLNRVTGGDITYSFFGGHVLFAFVYCPHATSPTEIIGYEPDHEMLTFVPVIQRKKGELPQLRSWVPYLFIDSGLGLVTGRDVWGYNKTKGEMRIPKDLQNDPAEFVAATMIYPTLDSSTRGQFVDLVTVKRTDQKTLETLRPDWTSSAHIMGAINDALGDWIDVLKNEAHDFLKLATGIFVPTVNLKQFRDEENNTLACYQSLVDCEAQMTRLKGAGTLPGKYELSVTPCESHQIEEDLGLSDLVGKGRHSVRFAFWVNMDFTNPPGRRIWKAS